ncbi:hypothetical protein EBR03_05040 [bacterium]|nr:hypothetical protein [bacterium]NBX82093.1 hypothetical protein [bacterium]
MVPEKAPVAAKKKSPKVPASKTQKALKEKEETLIEDRAVEQAAVSESRPVAETRPTAVFKEGDDYTLTVRYDKSLKLFVAEVVEISECKVQGMSREEVLKDLKIKLEDYLEDHRHQGGVPDPIFSKQYPASLNVPISQALFRKLDLLSRMNKTSLENLVSELLIAAAERKLDNKSGGQQKHGQSHAPQSQRHNHHGGRHGGGHNRNRHSQQNLDSRENFMEYVRNLEKGGNRWKK